MRAVSETNLRYTFCSKLYRTPPVEAHRPVLTYSQFPIQVCFPCNDHAQPAAYKAPTSVTDNIVKIIVVLCIMV